VIEFVHDAQPELGSLALLYPDAQHFLGPVPLDTVCGRSLFPETGDTIITEEVRKLPIRK
jgi:hypothetical protein